MGTNYIYNSDKIKDILVDDIIIGKELYSYKDKPSRANIVVETGDVLFAKMQNSIKVICINETNKNYIYSTGFYCLKDERILPEYLKYYFLSKEFNIKKDNLCQGATMKALNDNGLEQIEIEVPSISEQKRIVAIIDSLYSIIKLKNKQLDLLDELIKSRFVELFGDPETNPKGFKKVLLSDIAEYFNGLTYSPDNVSDNGTVVLRSSNIQNSQLDFADTVRVDCPIKEKLYVKDNDILMCSRNGSARLVGKVALIKNLAEPMSFGAFMMIVRSKYYPYLMTYFQMEAFRRQIATGATTTINQITGNMLNKISLPLPEMLEVNQFAAFVEQTDKSKSVCLEKIEKYTELYNKLMNDYFGG